MASLQQIIFDLAQPSSDRVASHNSNSLALLDVTLPLSGITAMLHGWYG